MYRDDTPEGVIEFCRSEGQPYASIELLVSENERLRWTIVELASHVHDCEELLSPRAARTVSEVRARLAAETDAS